MGKIATLSKILEAVQKDRFIGKRIVLTNGAFDLLHVGHVRYLQAAKDLGDILIVAINSDSSVRRLKGPTRPIFPADERAELIAALGVVDYVVIFEQDTVGEVICALRPDFHAKGTDYDVNSVPERDEVERCGGRVVIVGDPKDHSSSHILENFR